MDPIHPDTAMPVEAPATEGVPVAEQLQDLVIDSEDVGGFLGELAVFSADSVSATVGLSVLCGITLSRRRKALTVAGNSHEARLIDEVQRTFGDGPCLEAMRTHTTVLVEDTATEERWPDYCSVIADRGHLSVLCVPLELDEGATAALNFFAPQAHIFDQATIRNCELYASQAERSLRLAVRIGTKQQHADDLRDAMASRTAIDLACGIIMGQNRCSQAEAFGILKKASNGRNQKLRDVAEAMIKAVAGTAAVMHFEP
ncbi:GAF and ANTAR domain-containing protein [Paenarthrobacter sp. NPDC089989]|uniref:GAF and ANTAR domain-containing protein n=1 Tax=unclassified Paenarthrobacter TaxID=2634190 RepID=UPI0037FE798C